MDAPNPMSADIQRQQDRKRKRKALLAGGVVLGLGAAVTLAAWSDDVFGSGTFNTGSFELQGSVNGTTFADYDGPADTPTNVAALSFQLDASEMAPSQTVYAPLTIATSTSTSLDGTFTLSNVSATGSYAGVLTYRIFTEDLHGENCSPANATGLAATPWTGGDTALVNAVSGTNTPLVVGAAQAVDPVPGRQHLCIAVTMGNVAAAGTPGDTTRVANQTAVQSATLGTAADETTVTWVFNGQSTDA